MTGDPGAAARLTRRAVAALKQAAAPVACRSASDVLLSARRRRARAGVGGAAPAGDATAAARLAARAGAAVDLVAAPVTGRTAVEVLLCAGQRRTRGGIGVAALARDAAAAAGRRGHAGSAVELVAAPVARRTAADVLLGARERLARRGIGLTALARISAATTGSRRDARATRKEVPAPVARRTAADALRAARRRRA